MVTTIHRRFIDIFDCLHTVKKQNNSDGIEFAENNNKNNKKNQTLLAP